MARRTDAIRDLNEALSLSLGTSLSPAPFGVRRSAHTATAPKRPLIIPTGRAALSGADAILVSMNA